MVAMAIPQPVRRYTPQEYYALERAAGYKSDYYQGELFAMAGGTARHSLISGNVVGEVRQRLKGTDCRAYESNLRLKVIATGLRCYPDAGVYCGPLQFDTEDTDGETVTNPTVLFEVLSKTTEAYDRGLKSDNYRQIETLAAYVLVSHHAPHVEIYERQPSGHWLLREAKGIAAALAIPALAIDLPLSEIYAGVEFPPPPETDAVATAPR
jgi:Uma2 family endonuclease